MREKIRFVTEHTSLDVIQEVRPKSSKYFIPSWFSHTPTHIEDVATVKRCPALPDFFNQGYIIPSWCDMSLYFDKDSGEWSAATGFDSSDFPIQSHSHSQFIDHAHGVNFNSQIPSFIFKLINPWHIITKPGWSVMQLPLFYHFDNDFTIMPGVIDSDIHHEANLQLMYFGDKKEIIIKRGQPLVQYVPFKREKHSLFVGQANKKDKEKINLNRARYFSKFPFSGEYRKMQKERDVLK